MEGAGPKARPARSVASGPPHRSHTAAGSQLTPTPTRSSPAAGTTATRTRGSHARESGEESVASGAAPPNQRRVIPREPVLVVRSRAPGRSGVSCCSPVPPCGPYRARCKTDRLAVESARSYGKDHVPNWLWVVIIVIVVLALLGFFGRGRLSR